RSRGRARRAPVAGAPRARAAARPAAAARRPPRRRGGTDDHGRARSVMIARMKPGVRLALAVAIGLGALTVLHRQPGQGGGAANELSVGYLPVTCHLTCPVTDYATRTTTTSTRFLSQRYPDFPTVVESLKARKIDATFILAPLAMVLIEQGVPIKIVYL